MFASCASLVGPPRSLGSWLQSNGDSAAPLKFHGKPFQLPGGEVVGGGIGTGANQRSGEDGVGGGGGSYTRRMSSDERPSKRQRRLSTAPTGVGAGAGALDEEEIEQREFDQEFQERVQATHDIHEGSYAQFFWKKGKLINAVGHSFAVLNQAMETRVRRELRADRRRTRQERRLRREEAEDGDGDGDADADAGVADNGEADGFEVAKANSSDEDDNESASGSESTEDFDSDGSADPTDASGANSTRKAVVNVSLKSKQRVKNSAAAPLKLGSSSSSSSSSSSRQKRARPSSAPSSRRASAANDSDMDDSDASWASCDDIFSRNPFAVGADADANADADPKSAPPRLTRKGSLPSPAPARPPPVSRKGSLPAPARPPKRPPPVSRKGSLPDNVRPHSSPVRRKGALRSGGLDKKSIGSSRRRSRLAEAASKNRRKPQREDGSTKKDVSVQAFATKSKEACMMMSSKVSLAEKKLENGIPSSSKAVGRQLRRSKRRNSTSVADLEKIADLEEMANFEETVSASVTQSDEKEQEAKSNLTGSEENVRKSKEDSSSPRRATKTNKTSFDPPENSTQSDTPAKPTPIEPCLQATPTPVLASRDNPPAETTPTSSADPVSTPPKRRRLRRLKQSSDADEDGAKDGADCGGGDGDGGKDGGGDEPSRKATSVDAGADRVASVSTRKRSRSPSAAASSPSRENEDEDEDAVEDEGKENVPQSQNSRRRPSASSIPEPLAVEAEAEADEGTGRSRAVTAPSTRAPARKRLRSGTGMLSPAKPKKVKTKPRSVGGAVPSASASSKPTARAPLVGADARRIAREAKLARAAAKEKLTKRIQAHLVESLEQALFDSAVSGKTHQFDLRVYNKSLEDVCERLAGWPRLRWLLAEGMLRPSSLVLAKKELKAEVERAGRRSQTQKRFQSALSSLLAHDAKRRSIDIEKTVHLLSSNALAYTRRVSSVLVAIKDPPVQARLKCGALAVRDLCDKPNAVREAIVAEAKSAAEKERAKSEAVSKSATSARRGSTASASSAAGSGRAAAPSRRNTGGGSSKRQQPSGRAPSSLANRRKSSKGSTSPLRIGDIEVQVIDKPPSHTVRSLGRHPSSPSSSSPTSGRGGRGRGGSKTSTSNAPPLIDLCSEPSDGEQETTAKNADDAASVATADTIPNDESLLHEPPTPPLGVVVGSGPVLLVSAANRSRSRSAETDFPTSPILDGDGNKSLPYPSMNNDSDSDSDDGFADNASPEYEPTTPYRTSPDVDHEDDNGTTSGSDNASPVYVPTTPHYVPPSPPVGQEKSTSLKKKNKQYFDQICDDGEAKSAAELAVQQKRRMRKLGAQPIVIDDDDVGFAAPPSSLLRRAQSTSSSSAALLAVSARSTSPPLTAAIPSDFRRSYPVIRPQHPPTRSHLPNPSAVTPTSMSSRLVTPHAGQPLTGSGRGYVLDPMAKRHPAVQAPSTRKTLSGDPNKSLKDLMMEPSPRSNIGSTSSSLPPSTTPSSSRRNTEPPPSSSTSSTPQTSLKDLMRGSTYTYTARKGAREPSSASSDDSDVEEIPNPSSASHSVRGGLSQPPVPPTRSHIPPALPQTRSKYFSAAQSSSNQLASIPHGRSAAYYRSRGVEAPPDVSTSAASRPGEVATLHSPTYSQNPNVPGARVPRARRPVRIRPVGGGPLGMRRSTTPTPVVVRPQSPAAISLLSGESSAHSPRANRSSHSDLHNNPSPYLSSKSSYHNIPSPHASSRVPPAQSLSSSSSSTPATPRAPAPVSTATINARRRSSVASIDRVVNVMFQAAAPAAGKDGDVSSLDTSSGSSSPTAKASSSSSSKPKRPPSLSSTAAKSQRREKHRKVFEICPQGEHVTKSAAFDVYLTPWGRKLRKSVHECRVPSRLDESGKLDLKDAYTFCREVKHNSRRRTCMLLKVTPVSRDAARGAKALAEALTKVGRTMVVDKEERGVLLYVMPPNAMFSAKSLKALKFQGRPEGVLFAVLIIKRSNLD